VVATSSPTHVAGNNSYQAVIAKYCKAWLEHPNTCKYFEPTEMQLQLIVFILDILQRMPSKLLVTMTGNAIAVKTMMRRLFFKLYDKSHTGCYKEKISYDSTG